jgi:hypothetical protein
MYVLALRYIAKSGGLLYNNDQNMRGGPEQSPNERIGDYPLDMWN